MAAPINYVRGLCISPAASLLTLCPFPCSGAPRTRAVGGYSWMISWWPQCSTAQSFPCYSPTFVNTHHRTMIRIYWHWQLEKSKSHCVSVKFQYIAYSTFSLSCPFVFNQFQTASFFVHSMWVYNLPLTDAIFVRMLTLASSEK